MDYPGRLVRIALFALLAASACTATGPSGTAPIGTAPIASSAPGTSPITTGDVALAEAALAEAAPAADPNGLDKLEADAVTSAYAQAGVLDRIGDPAVLAAIADAQRTAGSDALRRLLNGAGAGNPSPAAAADPLAGQLAAAGSAVPPQLALSGADFSGNLATTGVLVRETMTSVPPSTQSSQSSTTSSVTRQATSNGTTANVTIQDAIGWVTNGSTITGTADVTTTVAFLDAGGNVVETVTTTSHGVVELDRCPAVDGSVKGDYELDLQVSSTAGGGSTYHASGNVVGIVLDDAFLHSYTVDSSGDVQNGQGVDRAVTVQAAWELGTAGDTSSGQLTSETGSVVRADAAATHEDLVKLGGNATGPGIFMAISLFAKAQDQWRNGACVKVESSVPDRNVEQDEQVQLTATVKHKIEGTSLQVPVKATLSGVKSIAPEDVDVQAPADFTYTASSQPGDRGTVHLVSRSRRGIGRLDVQFLVVPALVLELYINSTYDFTRYNLLSTDAEAHVWGSIRLERNKDTGLWSGTGNLSSTTASSLNGCQTITIVGSGQYDWKVSDVNARPGLLAQDLEVWMNNGPANESFDSYTARYCPAGAFTGNVNTWENAFFLTERSYYGQKGFHVTDFDNNGIDTTRWYHGLVLGQFNWLADCSGFQPAPVPNAPPIPPLAECTAGTEFTLRVVDPNQRPLPPP